MSRKYRIALFASLLCCGAEAAAQPSILMAPVPQSGALFGNSLSLSGDRLVVGAALNDTNGLEDAGIAYVFERQAGQWAYATTVLPQTPTAGAMFGTVALQGSRLAVGASRQGGGIGALYVFDRNDSGAWIQHAALGPTNPGATCGDEYGCHLFAVSVALDGDTVVAGASTEVDGSRVGAAYVFVRNVQGEWGLQARLTPNDAAPQTQFGNAVALDGDTLLVGAHFRTIGSNTYQGAAYVFVRNGAGVWTQRARLLASDGAAGDIFGFSVDLDGDTAIVGARLADLGNQTNRGAAYVFVRNGTAWNQQARLDASDGIGGGTGDAGDHFGYRVHVHGDEALISRHPGRGNNPAPDSNGAVYRFVRHADVWTEISHVTPKTGSPGDSFGASLGFNDRWIAVGAQYEGTPPGEVDSRGAVYVYDRVPDDRLFADDFDGDD